MCMNLDHVAVARRSLVPRPHPDFISQPQLRDKIWVGPGDEARLDVLCEFDYWPLAVSMPPTKVCPQCKDAVPVTRKTCERCDVVFRSKRKAECNLRGKTLTMKRMEAVESDSVKSARKAKDKFHKACERASETRERTLHGQEQNRMRMASLRSRDSDRFLVNTHVQSHALLRRGFGTSVPFICSGIS